MHTEQTTYLTKILEKKRERINKEFANFSIQDLRREAFEKRKGFVQFRLQNALQGKEKTNVIAEFKRASPSKGKINGNISPEEIAENYLNGGAAAISVLTEQDFFKGSFVDLKRIVRAIDDKLPVLCKDFIFDERQIYQSAVSGASAVLLIVAAFKKSETEKLFDLYNLAEELALDVLVEVHTREEIETARTIGAKIIGINNRNLQTFEVSLKTSEELIGFTPKDSILISESGIKTRNDILRLRNLGFRGFLIGETLMRSENAQIALKKFIGS
ncbi:MAG: indole-3-glycerol phosphate synthase TrpC [Acidobacteria bacterium]|nr:indole-3-glycerol phosphate synthase TrpC [Acidobacteriota bacterium]MCA1640211.1 indole-3-glycerol phosphate synthase TrpC [Acidobacteriota bacterium]